MRIAHFCSLNIVKAANVVKAMNISIVVVIGSLITMPAIAREASSHVVIISIDGGKPAIIESMIRQQKLPELAAIVKAGAYTWNGLTIVPSITLPSHTSMLSSLGPRAHHVDWNDWQPAKGTFTFETIFSLAKRAGLSTAFITSKEKFQHFKAPNTLDTFIYLDRGANEIGQAAADTIARAKPDLLFIHFKDVDEAGHAIGWDSPAQHDAFERVDRAIGAVRRAITSAKLEASTTVLITADHGGLGKSHSADIPDDRLIPWLAIGKGVRSGMIRGQQVITQDSAATAACLLALPAPANWEGRFVKEAFASPTACPTPATEH